ncbi:glycoside hydrolase family 105 protein [Jaapia argillacea MUCL 33604]|uniref:Glycoside hydrolase family 105 protein n=1 Tax=Jaapia argillacea MUCL 33604 TaxID=933084 RepID=A0A067PIK2_9AGAM|nr:glycoside hydrolase family 105 protein [Jaapia argillacea MUCL 33604]
MEQQQERKGMIEKVVRAMMCMSRASWEQGTAAQAMYELHKSFPEDFGTQYFVCLSHDAVVRQSDDGRLSARLCRGDQGSLDTTAGLEALIRAYEVTLDDFYLSAAKRVTSYLLTGIPKSENGTWSHLAEKVELWIDALYMGPPGLAAAGAAWGELEYIKEAIKQIKGYVDAMWDREQKLFSHIWDPIGKKFIRRAFWGVGNGWAISGMARVLDFIPESLQQDRSYIISVIFETINSLLSHIRPDHLFHDIVDDPSTFVETNLSQQLAYTIFTLRNAGYLAADRENGWIEKARLMRQAAWEKVDGLGLVQGVCGSPSFDHAGTATEGQAFFILMEAEYQKFLEHKTE